MEISTKTRQVFVQRNDLNRRFTTDLAKFNVMGVEEEYDIIQKYKATGDKKYRDMIINSNQRFLYATAKNYSNDPDIILELVNEANYGLLVALESYDLTRGFRFLSYAQAYVRKYMTEYFTRKSDIVANEFIRRCGHKVRKERESFYSENHRYPEQYELVDIMLEKYNIDISNFTNVTDQTFIRISGNVCPFDTSSDTYEDTGVFAESTASYNEYEDTIDNDHAKHQVKKMLSILRERDRDIIKMYYGIDYPEAINKNGIAEKYQISVTRVEQIINKAIEKIQSSKKYVA